MTEIKEEDMMIVKGLDNAGYDYQLKFCSLEGFECGMKKERAEQLKQQILQDHEDAKKYVDFAIGMNGEKLTFSGSFVKFMVYFSNSDMFNKLFSDIVFKDAWFKVLKKLDELQNTLKEKK